MRDNTSVKRTKIVATLGPATNSEEMIRSLAERGVDVVRINFSHGTDEERLATIA
ncbi:MAG: pyruvate kinase, partial [Candidatus Cryosericum sp.]